MPGPFEFAFEKLHKRGVITATADELASTAFLPHSLEADEKKRGKAISKATIRLAMLGPGELELSAAYKGNQLEWWATPADRAKPVLVV